MLSVFEKRYMAWGILIWSVVGILVGATVGLSLGWSSKMLAFLVVLGLGVVWLIALEVHNITRFFKPVKTPVSLAIPRKKEDVNIMSREEAREWLDDFLVKQQDN